MTEAPDIDSFARIVEWADGTLPQEIRDLPDFPGIQVAEEPPADVLQQLPGDYATRITIRKSQKPPSCRPLR